MDETVPGIAEPLDLPFFNMLCQMSFEFLLLQTSVDSV